MAAPADPPASGASPMMHERERARRVATGIVATALAIAGLTLVVLAVVMVMRGGAQLVLLAAIVGLLGLALAIAGFFFQLVPFRLDQLAQEKREYDARTRGR